MAWKAVDMAQYPRRAHFAYFSAMQYPYVGVTQETDVTELLAACRARQRSFYLSFLHAAALAADGVPELRWRIRAGGIVEYDACPTSHIELLEAETYCYCTLRHHMPLEEYYPYAEEARRQCRQRASIEEDAEVESLYFISTLPWLHYSALIQPVAGGEESNPRITWGQYRQDGAGRVSLPVTLLAHHALVDGIHIARFYENLDRELAAAKTRSELSMIEVKCSIGAREDLGRPTTTARENKEGFMDYLRGLE